jgi:hypothetical protein
MNEKYISPSQPVYLLKIILGLIVVAALIVAAYGLSLCSVSLFTRNFLMGVLFVVSSAIVPFVRRVYLKMDELQKLQHQNACVNSLPLIAVMSAIIGILQVNKLLPAFNQFWGLGMIAGVWAISLMLADRHYR